MQVDEEIEPLTSNSENCLDSDEVGDDGNHADSGPYVVVFNLEQTVSQNKHTWCSRVATTKSRVEKTSL